MPSEEPGKNISLPVFEIRRILHFGYSVQSKPDGGMILAISTPMGIRYEFPFDEDGRKSLGHDVLAPSILTPDSLPRR